MTTIVAEPGCTAEGDLDTMLRLVDAAADAGCDVYKAQWTSDAHAMAERRSAQRFEPYYHFLAYPLDWHDALGHKCAQRGLRYACSVYLPDDVPVIAPYVSAIKISSFEASDPAMIAAVRATDREAWVSTGMMDATAVEDLMSVLDFSEVTLLHCVSSYPTPHDQLNLDAICGGVWGFSDHSHPSETWTGALAVAVGAVLVEAHLRLPDANPSNPDVPHAMTPDQFGAYVQHIRYAEAALGDGVKRTMPCEAEMTPYRVQETT